MFDHGNRSIPMGSTGKYIKLIFLYILAYLIWWSYYYLFVRRMSFWITGFPNNFYYFYFWRIWQLLTYLKKNLWWVSIRDGIVFLWYYWFSFSHTDNTLIVIHASQTVPQTSSSDIDLFWYVYYLTWETLTNEARMKVFGKVFPLCQ